LKAERKEHGIMTKFKMKQINEKEDDILDQEDTEKRLA